MTLKSNEPDEKDAARIMLDDTGKELLYDEKTGRFFEASGSAKTLPLSTIFERTLDTAEDAVLMARRIPYDFGWTQAKADTTMETIVVLGSGWAAHAVLKVADTYKVRVVCISPTNHFVFTPSKYHCTTFFDY